MIFWDFYENFGLFCFGLIYVFVLYYVVNIYIICIRYVVIW